MNISSMQFNLFDIINSVGRGIMKLVYTFSSLVAV